MRRFLGLVALLAASTAWPLRAEQPVPADPWEVIHTARNYGPAEVGLDALRDPRIRAAMDGQPYTVDFYGCWLGRACETVLLTARLAREDWEPDAKAIAAWNRTKLYGRAWIAPEGGAVLDLVLPMQAGLPRETLEAGFTAWRLALRDFLQHIEFTD